MGGRLRAGGLAGSEALAASKTLEDEWEGDCLGEKELWLRIPKFFRLVTRLPKTLIFPPEVMLPASVPPVAT